jgi:hypothetical protein
MELVELGGFMCTNTQFHQFHAQHCEYHSMMLYIVDNVMHELVEFGADAHE